MRSPPAPLALDSEDAPLPRPMLTVLLEIDPARDRRRRTKSEFTATSTVELLE
jgi:hypothetical protein